jgi:hypothetical protein
VKPLEEKLFIKSFYIQVFPEIYPLHHEDEKSLPKVTEQRFFCKSCEM